MTLHYRSPNLLTEPHGRNSPLMLVVVRHGHYPGNSGLKEGKSLTDLGIEQATATAEWLRANGILDEVDTFVCSPFARARETAKIIRAGDWDVDPRLKERDRGKMGTLSRSELAERYPEDHRYKQDHPYTWVPSSPGAESLPMTWQRLLPRLKSEKGRGVLYVAHAELMWSVRGAFFDLDDEQLLSAYLDKDRTFYINNAQADLYLGFDPRTGEIADGYPWFGSISNSEPMANSGWIRTENPLAISSPQLKRDPTIEW